MVSTNLLVAVTVVALIGVMAVSFGGPSEKLFVIFLGTAVLAEEVVRALRKRGKPSRPR